LPLTVHSQVFPERFVYMWVYGCHIMYTVAFIWLHHRLISDRKFLGKRYENRHTKDATWLRWGGSDCWHCCVVVTRRVRGKGKAGDRLRNLYHRVGWCACKNGIFSHHITNSSLQWCQVHKYKWNMISGRDWKIVVEYRTILYTSSSQQQNETWLVSPQTVWVRG